MNVKVRTDARSFLDTSFIISTYLYHLSIYICISADAMERDTPRVFFTHVLRVCGQGQNIFPFFFFFFFTLAMAASEERISVARTK